MNAQESGQNPSKERKACRTDRTAQAFYDTCNELCVNIFEGELIVGASGEYRKCGILTPNLRGNGSM